MQKKELQLSKLLLNIIAMLTITTLAYSVGFHTPNEILSGTFSGDYEFTGIINLTTATIDGITNNNITAVETSIGICSTGTCDLRTLDGPGSQLDADTLDGYNSDEFIRTEIGDISSVTAGTGLTGGGTAGTITLNVGAGTGISVAANSISATLGTSIEENEITQNTLDDSEIQDNSLTAASLAPNSCGNSELINTPSFSSVYSSAYYYSSDRNLKQDITKIKSALQTVEQLQGVNFKWKDNNQPSIGFIAQDVEQILPQIVNTNNYTNYKTIEYGIVTALLVEAIKEQQEIINQQQKEINIIKNEITQWQK